MKDRLLYIASLVALSITLIVSSFFVGQGVNNLFSQKMPDLSLSTKEAVLEWIDEKLLTHVDIIDDFSNTVPANYVISQSIKKDINISRSTPIVIYVSKGSDPNEIIRIPDFTGKDIGVIQQWIKANYLSNAEIEFEMNLDVEPAIFVRSNRQATSMKRSDNIRFTISTGTQATLTKIIMNDLVGLSEEEANLWAQENGINLIYDRVYSDDYDANYIISQAIQKDTEVWKGSSVQIVVSKGPSITLINFYNISKSQIDQYIESKELYVEYTYRYHDSIAADYGISMSPSAYSTVERLTNIQVVLSLGRIQLTDVSGLTKDSFEQWIDIINVLGGSLTYEYVLETESSDYQEGIITRTNQTTTSINIGTHLKIFVSQGTIIHLPDFTSLLNRPIAEVQATLESLGLEVQINEVESNQMAGTVVSIDASPDTVYKPGDIIKINVAKEKP